MHLFIFVVLLAVLIATIVFFVVMGTAQRRRRQCLLRRAHERGLRFSVDDPFDVSRRYDRFVLISSGHSPHARNVTYGRIDGHAVRMFDFRCEAGHGTRRVTRYYGVCMVETNCSAPPPALLWDATDTEAVPLAVYQADGRVGRWFSFGHPSTATVLAAAGDTLPCSMQFLDGDLMLFAPVRDARDDFSDWLDGIPALLNALNELPADASAGDGH